MLQTNRYPVCATVIFVTALLSLTPKTAFAQWGLEEDAKESSDDLDSWGDEPKEAAPEPEKPAEPAETDKTDETDEKADPYGPPEPEPELEPELEPVPEPEPEAAPPEQDLIKFKAWGRVGSIFQSVKEPDKLDDFTIFGQTDLHMFGNVTPFLDYSLGVGGKIGRRNGLPPIEGNTPVDVVVLDLRLGLEVVKEFNIWVGRLLIPADRLSLSGPYHVSTLFMPGEVGGTSRPMPAPQAGPDGRNNGATIWGSIGGGKFKYYAGTYNLHRPEQSPIFSGRLQLAVLDPEAPAFNQPDTYFGHKKQLLTFGVGAQYWKNGSRGSAPVDDAGDPLIDATTGEPQLAPTDDFAALNADVLFELGLESAGSITVEGSFIKHIGEYERYEYGWFGLLGYLIPAEVGPGKFFPVVRFHQSAFRDSDATEIKLDAQVGYIVKGHDAKFYLGYQRFDSGGTDKGNMIVLGAQLKQATP